MKEFLKIAEDLYKIGVISKGKKKEFYFRSAVSRVYYGVLWYIRDLYNLKGTDLHGMARAVVGEKDKYLYNLLLVLSRYRNYADYQKNPPIDFNEKNTKIYLEKAKEIITRLPR